MHGLTKSLTLGILLALSNTVLAFEGISFKGFFEAQVSRDRGEQPWLKEGNGKLRYNAEDEGIQLNQAAAEIKWEFLDSWKAQTVIHGRDSLNKTVDPTELFLEYKPAPTSSFRYQVKLGAFYPKFSLENTAVAWSNRYLLSSSAINTWIGEEIRTIGSEFQLERMGKLAGSPNTWNLSIGLTTANDPAGTLLAWRGWAIHDRQTTLTETIPLPAVPSIGEDGIFARQPQWVKPFVEIDDRIGWYINTGWKYKKRSQLILGYYDNEGRPDKTNNDGQYSWDTHFMNAGWKYRINKNFSFLTQWMKGKSSMGRSMYGQLPLLIEFESNFSLLSYQWKTDNGLKQRLSGRYDHFEVIDLDNTWMDNNNEHGHGWALAYLVSPTPYLQTGIEAGIVRSNRQARMYFGDPTKVLEKSIRLSVRLFL